MLGDHDAVATVAVEDLQSARSFYGETVGLKEQAGAGNPEVITYQSGSSKLMVYRSQYAGTNEATVVTWPVGAEIDAIVTALSAKGVVFEHYDLPQLTLHGDIHVAGDGFKVAWFKDPDGNILSIVSPGT